MTVTQLLLAMLGFTAGYELTGLLLRRYTSGGHRGWVNLHIVHDDHIRFERIPAGDTVELHLPDHLDASFIWSDEEQSDD